MNWRLTVVVASNEGATHNSTEHSIHAASQASAAAALLAKGIEQQITAADELLILVVPDAHPNAEAVAIFRCDDRDHSYAMLGNGKTRPLTDEEWERLQDKPHGTTATYQGGRE